MLPNVVALPYQNLKKMRTLPKGNSNNRKPNRVLKELILLGLYNNKGKFHYKQDYVDRIRKAEKEPFVDVDLNDYGITI